MPELNLPVTKFYGKSGTPLDIIARVDLTFSADGKIAKVPVFVQPSSEQSCLLGSNIFGCNGAACER